MTTRRRWTEEEDKLLVQAITANPTKIKRFSRAIYYRLKFISTRRN